MMSDPRQSPASLPASPGNSRCSRTCRYFHRISHSIVCSSVFPTGQEWLICSKNNIFGRSLQPRLSINCCGSTTLAPYGSVNQLLRLCSPILAALPTDPVFLHLPFKTNPFFSTIFSSSLIGRPPQERKKERMKKKKYEEEWLGCVLLSEFEVREYFAARREIRS